MKVEMETSLSIDQPLYYLKAQTKTVYAPCPMCNNRRTVDALIQDKTYQVDCPRCTRKVTKGDINRTHTQKIYNLGRTEIRCFIYGRVDGTDKMGLYASMNGPFASTLIIDVNTLASLDVYSKRQCYLTEEEANAELKRLNKEEARKRKEFLAQFENAGE